MNGGEVSPSLGRGNVDNTSESTDRDFSVSVWPALCPKTHRHLHQSQKRSVSKVEWTCPPNAVHHAATAVHCREITQKHRPIRIKQLHSNYIPELGMFLLHILYLVA